MIETCRTRSTIRKGWSRFSGRIGHAGMMARPTSLWQKCAWPRSGRHRNQTKGTAPPPILFDRIGAATPETVRCRPNPLGRGGFGAYSSSLVGHDEGASFPSSLLDSTSEDPSARPRTLLPQAPSRITSGPIGRRGRRAGTGSRRTFRPEPSRSRVFRTGFPARSRKRYKERVRPIGRPRLFA